MILAVAIAVIASLAALYYRAGRQIAMDKRLHLSSYVVYLLLSDETRTSHRRKLLDFLRTIEGGPETIGAISMGALERLADDLAINGNSVVAATGMLADAKRNLPPA